MFDRSDSMFFSAWLTILRDEPKGCFTGTKSSKQPMVNKLLVKVSAVAILWEIAILLCPSRLDGYRGKHWGEVFQQPAKGFAYEAVHFTHFLSCLHVRSWLPGLILSSTQPLRKSPPIHIRYTLWRSR